MRIDLITLITLISISLPNVSWSQDSLMLKTGEMVAFVKLYQFEDSVELKIPRSRKRISYALDDVFGYYDILNEQSYYLLNNPETNEYDPSYVFLERTIVGAIDMYIDNTRDYKMYLKKNEETHLIYRTLESQSANNERIDILKKLVINDDKSVEYIGSQEFKFKPREIEMVVNQYNQRNFKELGHKTQYLTKQIFFYRTKFQKTKEVVRVWFNGISHKLYIEDFIQIDVPVKYPSKITITDGLLSTERIISADLAEQYFEVIYDSKTNSYLLDPKTGSELHFEFNRIKDKIEKTANR